MNDVSAMQQFLGLPDAPMVRNGLAEACRFFRHELGVSPDDWQDYFRGIDFHCPVALRELPEGTQLARHVSTGRARPKPFVYFTIPGTSPTSTGTTFPAVRFERYRVQSPVRVLVSVAAPISFNNLQKCVFDDVSRMGGGTQYILASRDLVHLVAL